MILDVYNFTGQYDLLGFYPLMTFFAIIFLFGLMIFCYLKIRVFIVILGIYLFSLVIGIIAFNESVIPFTPYLQIFFLIFQTILFVLVVIQTFENDKKGI